MIFKPIDQLAKPRKKRKPEISPTKLRIFLSCPLMYKYQYVTRIGKFNYTPNVGDSFGGSLHRALHDFHASGGPETQDAKQLIERLRNTWVSTGYSSVEQEKEHLEIGARILEDYFANIEIAARTLFTEKQLREDMGDFILTGRLDRLDERSDGTLDIIDYKSGRATVTEEQVANDLAMSIYQLLVRRLYPGRRVVATIHCLRTGHMASAELSDDEITELEALIRAAAIDMLSIATDTEIQPHRKDACDRCDFIKICDRKARVLGLEWNSDSTMSLD